MNDHICKTKLFNQIENTFKKVFYLWVFFLNMIKCYTFQIPFKGMYNISHQWDFFYDVSGISENMGESHSS